jgi:hypothetical protein
MVMLRKDIKSKATYWLKNEFSNQNIWGNFKKSDYQLQSGQINLKDENRNYLTGYEMHKLPREISTKIFLPTEMWMFRVKNESGITYFLTRLAADKVNT